MITYGSVSLYPELKRLWIACYPGDEAYCDFYFNNYFSPEHCCVCVGENGLESAFYWFDAKINVGEARLPMLLLYAGATFPEYRKKGNITQMLHFVTEHCRRNGIYGFVINALETSKRLSEHYGMQPNIRMVESLCSPSGIDQGWIWQDLSLEAFTELRREAVDQKPYSIYWEGKSLSYMYEEIKRSGAILGTKQGENSYYAVITHDKASLLIMESNVPCSSAQKLVDSICLHENYMGQVRLLSREGELPVLLEEATSELRYYAHSFLVIPHDKLLCLRSNPCTGVSTYLNLTAE